MTSHALPRHAVRSRRRPSATATWLATIDRASHLVNAWRERSRQRRHLGGLTERMLRDIGVSRADVAGEGAKPFWRL